MKFCPECASVLEVRCIDDVERKACTVPECGFVHWDNPVPVVAALIEFQGKIVLARNSLKVTESFWQDLTSRFGDFSGHLLVSCFSFDEDWENWEIHPHGDELVCLLSGDVDFILERNGGRHAVRLNTSGSFVIVPRGTWHTARVRSPSSALFVTPGQGTTTKPAGNRGIRKAPARVAKRNRR